MIRGTPALLEALGGWHLWVISINIFIEGSTTWTIRNLPRTGEILSLLWPLAPNTLQILPDPSCPLQTSGLRWVRVGGGRSFIYILHSWKLGLSTVDILKIFFFCYFYQLRRNHVFFVFYPGAMLTLLYFSVLYEKCDISRTQANTSVGLTIISSRLPSSSWICQ